jgi:hypothetical protein
MKSILPILAIVCFFDLAFGQTKIYNPFPKKHAIWNQIYVKYPAPPEYFSFQYTIDGTDTLISGKNYLKIFLNNSVIVGAYRQDTIHKQVFALNFNQPHENKEYLLYDFSLEVGDTFSSRPLADCDSNSIVQSIDSILIMGTFRKKINLVSQKFSTNVSIIEGIGSLDGLFEASCFEASYGLCSFLDGIDTLFINKNFGCYTGIKETERKVLFKLSPNPFSDRTTLTLNVEKGNSRIIVYNLWGNEVRRIEKIEGQTVIIDREDLRNGVYLLYLTIDNILIQTQKLIIADQ